MITGRQGVKRVLQLHVNSQSAVQRVCIGHEHNDSPAGVQGQRHLPQHSDWVVDVLKHMHGQDVVILLFAGEGLEVAVEDLHAGAAIQATGLFTKR